MEPKNHPIEKENHLPDLHEFGFKMLIFQGVFSMGTHNFHWFLAFITWVVALPMIPVTTRIITFLVGDPYKPSFATGILGGGTTQFITYITHTFKELSTLMFFMGFVFFRGPRVGFYIAYVYFDGPRFCIRRLEKKYTKNSFLKWWWKMVMNPMVDSRKKSP